MSQPQFKDCMRCEETKPVGEFHRDPSRKDGYHHYCKTCVAALNAQDDARNRRLAANASWYVANNERQKQRVANRRKQKGSAAPRE